MQDKANSPPRMRIDSAIDAVVREIETGKVSVNDLIVGSLGERLQSLQVEIRSGSQPAD